jgi:NAD(P)H-flavin reductase
VALPVFSAFHPSALTERTHETIDHVVFAVATTDAMRAAFQRPGQFVKMRVRGADGAEHEGIFAIASAPFEARFSFLVRMNNPAGGEAADRIARMPMTEPIEVTLPAGDGFALERARGRDLALVGVGTALAPIRSALEEVLRDRASYGALSLDYGLRTHEHLPFRADVERWRSLGVEVSLHPGLVHADGTIEGVRAQDALFERLGPRVAQVAVLAVGHDALVREVRARYVQAGGAADRVLHNY